MVELTAKIPRLGAIMTPTSKMEVVIAFWETRVYYNTTEKFPRLRRPKGSLCLSIYELKTDTFNEV